MCSDKTVVLTAQNKKVHDANNVVLVIFAVIVYKASSRLLQLEKYCTD